jgi:two-component system chemotaxis response regulator CheB
MIRVLIVEDSIVTQEMLRYILDSDPDINVIGIAGNGNEALSFIERSKPDLITMDIDMPDMDGFETTRRIMTTNPIPIVIVTASWNVYSQEAVFRSMEAGALTIMEKPRGIAHPDHGKDARKLINIVKLMSEVRVVTRHCNRKDSVSERPRNIGSMCQKSRSAEIIAIGASTGGPITIQGILKGLPAKDDMPPVLIVQHIAEGFLEGLVEWLVKTTGKSVSIAADGEIIKRGHVYFAPDHFNMGIANNGMIRLREPSSDCQICPSVAHLFEAVALAYGSRAIGVLLTGMGIDGAAELKLMRERGAITIAQHKDSAVVYGMPREAVRLGAARYILNPDEIAFIVGQL